MKKIITLFLLFATTNALFGNVAPKANLQSVDSLQEIQVNSQQNNNSTYQTYKAPITEVNGIPIDSALVSAVYVILSDIKKNTAFNFWGNDWNLYNLCAILIAVWGYLLSILTFVFAILQYKSQKLTEEHTRESEKHTKNVPISVQLGKINDLPRHFYRNLVCTCAMIYRFVDEENVSIWMRRRKSYPSEAHFYKLQTLPDDIFLPIDVDEKFYRQMHELRLKFRNYNIEVDVACNHIKMQKLPLTALACDFDNLLFKPLNLTTDTFKYGESLGAAEQEYKAMIAIIKCHFENMIKAENLSKLIKQIPAASKLLKNECEYIKKNIEKEEDGGIKRSLKNLCKKNSSNNEECSLNKNSVLEQLYPKTNKNNSKQDADNEKIIRQLVNLEKVDKEYFNKWITSVFNGHQDAIQSASDIYDALKPYLDYINMEKWDFRTLFYYMLAVDTIIESRKIGMINY